MLNDWSTGTAGKLAMWPASIRLSSTVVLYLNTQAPQLSCSVDVLLTWTSMLRGAARVDVNFNRISPSFEDFKSFRSGRNVHVIR